MAFDIVSGVFSCVCFFFVLTKNIQKQKQNKKKKSEKYSV